ncbi:MAG: heparan-alpha-glucosaminide N-acetyltransferase [Desulfosporosinus sp.]|nr:heparan-alpha-glucosaminide N-acetyltransferase [Desulfosporosinus sp.]
MDKYSLNKRIVNQRYGEIDVLRAIAIVLMVLFHCVYDLNEFAGVPVDYQAPLWFLIGKTSALLFIFISGLASGLSRSPVRRGLKVLFFGMVITVVTYLFMKEEYIRFGILHFLGVAMILSPFLFRLSSRTLWGLASVFALLGFWFKGQVVQTSLFLPFGLMYDGFSSLDYYPIFPYLAVTLLGILAYRHFYAQRKRSLFPFRLNFELIEWVSRNSLGIYLIHQPIILFIIFIVHRI